ncbi:MAG TPA: metallophosphoesterase [Planctomycetota bacterium]|nr:metallophosphoesterase [Planctomycetota bacterium]
MSTFVYATDLHGNREAYERLFSFDADAVVLGGDLLPYPLKMGGDLIEPQRRFVAEYLAGKLATRPCYWIPGNDDWEAVLPGLGPGGIPIHGRAVPFLDGFSIAGYGCVPVTPFGMKDFDRFDVPGWKPGSLPRRCLRSTPRGVDAVPLEEVESRGTIEADLERLALLSDPARTVYVMHSPPFATRLDRLEGGIEPIGSRAIRRFIDRRQPPLTLHGHIHESPGVERLGRTVSVNPGDSMNLLAAVRVDLADLSVTPLGAL